MLKTRWINALLRKSFLFFCCCWLNSAGAMEIDGVTLADKIRFEETDLFLNGAGVRTKLFFKFYVAGLYLPKKNTNAEEIINAKQPKRIVMHVVRSELSGDTLLDGFRAAIANNYKPSEIDALRPKLQEMESLFSQVKLLRRGDIIQIDFLPDTGIKVMLGKEQIGVVSGDEIQRILLRIWLGRIPASYSLKKDLLGMN